MEQSSKRKVAVKKVVKEQATRKKAASTGNTSVKKKAVIRKSATTKEVTKKTVASKPAKPAMADIPSISITSEDRWKMIAIAAYHKAEARGFAPGDEVQDWLEAEEEIDSLIQR